MGSDKKENCGLFGIFGDADAVKKTYFGLHSLQHRGQESAGIASSDGKSLQCFTGMGTVSRVFRSGRDVFEKLANSVAIGHVRYSTTGAKPTHVSKPDPLAHVLNHLQGAYSLLFLFSDRIEAARDPYGIRPLCIGQTEQGAYVVASETCAFEAVGARFVREVEPGEIVRLDKDGLTSRFFVTPGTITPAHCIFEHVYFAKQTSTIFDENVHGFRKKLGRQLAVEHPVDADVVIPVPDSGTSSAIGYAEQSKIPFDMGIVRSHYVGRTFISPDQRSRELEVRLKPPIRFPCFYGVDFPTKEELLANNRNLEQIKEFLEVDSVGYTSLEGLLQCAALPEDHYCTACWSGNYRIARRPLLHGLLDRQLQDSD